MYRIWRLMDFQPKVLKKKLKNVSFYAQIVTEKKQPNSKIGILTKLNKRRSNGKSNRYGKRHNGVKDSNV